MTSNPRARAAEPAPLSNQVPGRERLGNRHAGEVCTGRRLVYQPLVNLQTLDVVGAEALTRFVGPAANGRTVASMIRDLERTRTVVEHGRWVLSQSAYDWWKVAPRGWRLNLNVSPMELNCSGYVDELLRWHPRGGVALELTETSSEPLSPLGLRNRARLGGLEIPLILDDLGDGYNSVRRMLALNVEEVKLSRRWSAGIGVCLPAEERLSEILQRLHDLGGRVTVEGVETVEQVDWLRHHGVQRAQGFVVARPMPMDELRSLGRWGTGVALSVSGGFTDGRQATTEPAAQ